MPNTLFGRLLLASLIVLGLYFTLMGYIASQLFIDNRVASKHEQLRLQNQVLLSAAQFGDNTIELPEELREARFDTYESGLYGYISSENGDIIWSSYSAHSVPIDPQLLIVSNPTPGKAQFLETAEYFVYHYNVLWEFIDDQPQLLTFSVLEDRRPTQQTINQFQQRLSLWLSAIGAVLIVMLLLLLRWGTQPLRQLARKLKQVESGEADRLEGNYPLELHAVTHNLNELLVAERRQRERYRATLADLAHSLKTPLAVIRAELDGGGEEQALTATLIADQTSRMDEIISHQLQRAVASGPRHLGETVDIEACVERLILALEKVYAEKHIAFILKVPHQAVFKGDERDLIEVMGNLLDNACKACKNSIEVTVQNNKQSLHIAIHDDGDGIPAALRDQLVKRGVRADLRSSGQGIGLDVARDIIQSYGGEMTIAESHLGGALFQISLPA